MRQTRQPNLAHYPVAMALKVAARCDNGSAWRVAVDTGFEKLPAADFIHVALRYLCFSVSTAAVDLKRLLGEQGLHALQPQKSRRCVCC